MGGCVSKNNKKKKADDDGEGKGKKTTSASRDPPPTHSESESHLEEEMVKEVLSETPKFIVNAAAAAARRPAPSHKKKGSSDLADLDHIDRGSPQVIPECLSAASTTTTVEAEQEEEVGNNQIKMRSSASPVKIQNMPGNNIRSQTSGGGGGGRREASTRGVDVGCRSGRSSASPMGNAGNRNRRPISSSSCPSNLHPSYSSNGNVVNNYKKRSEDSGERSGRRSMSPATNRRGLKGATTSTATADQQRECMMRGANGRPSPQRQRTPAPARVVDLGELGKKKMGQAQDEDGSNYGEGKEGESLENPLVSMECFIFL